MKAIPSFNRMTQRQIATGDPARLPSDTAIAPASARRALPMLRVPILAGIAVLLLVAPFTATPGWLAMDSESGFRMLVIACALYALLLALPFVPSLEIGLVIMMVFGKWGVVGAYLATVAGLNLAYGIARAMPCVNTLERDRLPPTVQRGLRYLDRHCPRRIIPVAALALLLNLPGNSAIGGGGGIALLYGAGRALSWPRFAVTVALATAVLPTLFFIGLL